jgi:tetratricopeptide (TPR) repeat protein
MITEVMKYKGDVAGCLKEAKTQQRLFRAAQDTKGEALALLEEADARYQKGDFEDALAVATKAQEMYKDSGDKTGEATALGVIAEINQMLNDAEAVLKASARQRSLLKSTADKRGEAAAALRACHSRLYVLSNSGHARGSQEYHEVWNRAFKEAKDGMMLAYHNGDDFVYAQSFYILAQVYVAVNDKGAEALQCASQCSEMYKELGDTRGEAQALVTVAHASHLLSKDDETAEALTKAMSLFQEIGDPSGQAIVMQAMQQFMGVKLAPVGMLPQLGQWDASAQAPQKQAATEAPQANAPAKPAGPIKLDPEMVANTIKDAVSAITMMDVDPDEPLMQAGLTSNTTVILRNELANMFPGKQMPFTLVFDHPSVNAIADFIAE